VRQQIKTHSATENEKEIHTRPIIANCNRAEFNSNTFSRLSPSHGKIVGNEFFGKSVAGA
ncbi:MAG: hypothetical protein ABJA02_02630, partial [Acidobacteriota bacterium]